MKSILAAITRIAVSKPLLSLLATVILVASSSYIIAENISVVTDTDAMIDPDLPFRKRYAQFQADFPQFGNTVAIVIEADTPEMRDRARDALYKRLQSDAALFSSVFSVTALPYFKNNGLLLLDYDDLASRMDSLVAAQPLLGPLLRDPSAEILLSSLAEALEEEGASAQNKETVSQLLSDVEQTAAAVLRGDVSLFSLQSALLGEASRPFEVIIVQPALDKTKVQPAKAALEAMRSHIQSVRAQLPGPTTISLTGKIALNAEELTSVSSGAGLAGLLSLVLVAIILYFGARSVRAVLAMVLTLVVGLIITAAAALIIFGALNIVSVAFAVLFIGLGVDFAIHLFLRAREAGPHVPMPEALVHSSTTSGLALAICAPTTALAFLSFTPTAYVGLAQLGVIAAIGVFVAFGCALTVLPACLVAFGVRTTNERVASGSKPALRSKSVLLITALGLLPALYVASTIGFEADPISLKDPNAVSVQTFDRLAQNPATSPYALQLLAPNEKAAADAAARAAEIEAVGRVIWLGRYVPEEQRDKRDLIEETYFVLAPDLVGESEADSADGVTVRKALERLNTIAEREAFTALLDRGREEPDLIQAFSDQLIETLPDLKRLLKDQLEGPLTVDDTLTQADLPEALVDLYRTHQGAYRVELYPATAITDEPKLRNFLKDVRAEFPDVTGSPVQIVEAARIVQSAMLQATLTAFGLVSVFLFLLLRSVRKVALILIPVFIAGAFTLATAALMGLAFNFANVIVLPLLLGLGVDAGIHYVQRAFEVGETGHTGSTDRAVFFSALTTIASFGTLMVSSHAGTASMGILLTISLFWLLVSTLIVLPALIRAWQT